MRATRWWLTLFYALATVLAQGLHDHHAGADESLTRHEAGCSDQRPHVAGHPSVETDHLPIDCVACQFRAEHHACPFAPVPLIRPDVVASWENAPPPSHTRQSRLISCRGPPRD